MNTKTQIFGQRGLFAVECHLSDGLFCRMRIWLKGIPLGNDDVYVPIGVVLGKYEDLVQRFQYVTFDFLFNHKTTVVMKHIYDLRDENNRSYLYNAMLRDYVRRFELFPQGTPIADGYWGIALRNHDRIKICCTSIEEYEQSETLHTLTYDYEVFHSTLLDFLNWIKLNYCR